MLLSELLKGVNVKNEYIDREISDVTDNTKKVTGNCAFVCVSGARFDGHNFAKMAVENGAVALFCPPLGIIDDSVLWFTAQLLVFVSNILGFNLPFML